MKKTPATAAPGIAPAFAILPVESLFVSPCNVRTRDAARDLDSLVANIRAHGLIQPLVVRPSADGRFEVIAGQRRLMAGQRLAEERPDQAARVPCLIQADLDEGGAVAVSLAENVERLPMEGFAQCEAFERLLQHGRGIKEIAASFGVPQKVVKQRLALAGLIEPIKTLVRERKLDGDDAQRLALVSPERQRAWLALRNDPQERAPVGYQLKQWLFGGQPISTQVALFSLKDCPEQIVEDLFGTERYFRDAGEFWVRQNKAVALRQEEMRAQGWERVIALDASKPFYPWDYRPVSKDQGGWTLIEVTCEGAVKIHEGFLPNDEVKRREKIARGEAADAAPEPAKPARGEVTQAMLNDLALHKANGVRLAVMDDPALALRLAVAFLAGGAAHWNVRADETRPAKPEIEESVRQQAGGREIARRRDAARTRLFPPEVLQQAERLGRGRWCAAATRTKSRVTAVFRTLLDLGDDEVLRLLAVAVAETLVAGSAFTELLGQHLQVDLLDTWKADRTFVDLLSDKAALGLIAAEWGVAPAAKATGSELRHIIGRQLDGQGCLPVAGWLPAYLRFPFAGYAPDRPAPEVRARCAALAAILDGSAVYRERYAGCFGGPSGLEDEMEDEEGDGADGQGDGMANEDFGLDEDSDFGDDDFGIDAEEVA